MSKMGYTPTKKTPQTEISHVEPKSFSLIRIYTGESEPRIFTLGQDGVTAINTDQTGKMILITKNLKGITQRINYFGFSYVRISQ